jgi:hypothetical protein
VGYQRPGANHGGDRKSGEQRSKSEIADFDTEDYKRLISRWRQKLNDPNKFESAFEIACARYTKILEFQTTAHVGHNSGENEWYTPPDYIDAARSLASIARLAPLV